MPHFNPNKEYESNLAKIRVEEGYTLKELAALANTSLNTLIGLQNGMVSPIYELGKRFGQPKPVPLKLAEILKCSLADLFPRYICDIQRSKALPDGMELEVTCGEFSRRNENSGHYAYILTKEIDSCLAERLSERQRFVIEQRFWHGEFMEDIGKILGVSRERVRQIEVRALKRLRLHSIAKRLEGFWRDGTKEAYG